MEAIVATVIAVIAVLGLAYSFGQGRAMIGRYEIARVALAAAQDEMETLSVTPPNDPALAIGSHTRTFVVGGQSLGMIQWNIGKFDDPANGLGGTGFDLKQVVVTVSWTAGFDPGSVSLTRFFPSR